MTTDPFRRPPGWDRPSNTNRSREDGLNWEAILPLGALGAFWLGLMFWVLVK